MNRELDIIIIGATGFTGQRAARELERRAPAGLRWGLAARSAERLSEVVMESGVPPSFVVDVFDREALRSVVRRAEVVANTAGPFALYGDPVLEACVECDTHYCDLSGEVGWMRRVGDRFHAEAKERGLFIVPACGFDSIPADLGVLELGRVAAGAGETLERIHTFYRLAGGLNGGTLASALEVGEHEDPRLLANPWALVPDTAAEPENRGRLGDPSSPAWDPVGQRWGAPFFMHAINSRVVRRSIALGAGRAIPGVDGDVQVPSWTAYEEYQTVSQHGGRVRTQALTVAQRLGERALRHKPGRWIARKLGPSPGEGPSEETIESGVTQVSMRAMTESGRGWSLEQRAKGDPGNAVTVRCLVQAALCLAKDGEAIGIKRGNGGVLTPATAMGRVLLERLERTGEHSFELSAIGEPVVSGT